MKQFAILWDMDGVLVDTGEAHFLTWEQALGEIGITYTREDFRATFGMNNAGTLEYIYGEPQPSALVNQLGGYKEELFREMVQSGADLLPGVADWIERFKSWGWKQAIASSAPWENIDALVDGLKIRSQFDAIVSGFDLPPKPAPDVFLKAASEIGGRPENSLVFEDSLAGVGGAVNAGMRCVAVTTTNPREALHQAGLVFDDLTELTPEALLAFLEAEQ